MGEMQSEEVEWERVDVIMKAVESLAGVKKGGRVSR